jgi:hypothetical protein
MPIHWNYMPVLEGERSEMAHRAAARELIQAGHFRDQAQIVARYRIQLQCMRAEGKVHDRIVF